MHTITAKSPTTVLLRRGFWKAPGQLQNYIDFMLRELNPKLSQRRLIAPIVAVEATSVNSVTLTLRPPKRWGGFVAGQAINIMVPIDGRRVERSYSICSTPAYFKDTGLISITVKKQPHGLLSNELNEQARIGGFVTMTEAYGDFHLPQSEPQATTFKHIVLVAAGSGITPIASIIKSALEAGMPAEMELIYTARNAEQCIFLDQLKALASSHQNFHLKVHFSESNGRLSEQSFLKYIDHNIDQADAVYICGPDSFANTLLPVLKKRCNKGTPIHQELFGSSLPPDTTSNPAQELANPVTVTFVDASKKVSSNGDKTLLTLGESGGVALPYGCRKGICRQCAVTLQEGQVWNHQSQTVIKANTDSDSLAQQSIQSCVCTPLSDVVIGQISH